MTCQCNAWALLRISLVPRPQPPPAGSAAKPAAAALRTFTRPRGSVTSRGGPQPKVRGGRRRASGLGAAMTQNLSASRPTLTSVHTSWPFRMRPCMRASIFSDGRCPVATVISGCHQHHTNSKVSKIPFRCILLGAHRRSRGVALFIGRNVRLRCAYLRCVDTFFVVKRRLEVGDYKAGA